MYAYFVFFFYGSGNHRDLHSFPTRRSSDLCSPRGSTDRRAGSRTGSSSRRSSCSSRRACARSLWGDRKSTRLNSSHVAISYAVFCLKKKIYLSAPASASTQEVKREKLHTTI